MKSSKEPIISLEGVNKNFRLQDGRELPVLHDISLDIEPASFSIIYGPSGSGKSTLLNVMAGLEGPTSGNVTVSGTQPYRLEPDQLAAFRSTNIGIIYQQNYWIASLSIAENVAFPLYLAGYNKGESLAAARELLAKVGIDHLAENEPGGLSGGEQQRASVARALVTSPKIILADEPTGSLDTKNGDIIMNLLSKVVQTYGITVVLVTHNLEYLPLSSQQIYIKDGRAVERTGRPADVTKALVDLRRIMQERPTAQKDIKR